ncbi:hypothetical protein [Consotaella aegiceratis]|uniref:hypothetical protein n=1 Tax=Consotaella aegiceratis TaxID=3097961 RepID=UPI002F42B139
MKKITRLVSLAIGSVVLADPLAAWAQVSVPYRGVNGTVACQADTNAVRLDAGEPLDDKNSWPTDCVNCISHALMVTDPSVVGEMIQGKEPEPPADAAWSLRHLLTPIGGFRGPGSAIADILGSMVVDQKIHGDTVERRPEIENQIIDPWLAAVGVDKFPSLVEILNSTGDHADSAWNSAPFKLIAIGYRPDLVLRDFLQNNVLSGGEGRFIFQAISTEFTFLPFTIILEYHLPASNIDGVTKWATSYEELRLMNFGANYNQALASITRDFTDRDVDHGTPNNVSIGQIRTNELLAPPSSDHQWELREFRLSHDGTLIPSTVKMTPPLELNDPAQQEELISFLRSDEFRRSFPSTTIPWVLNGKPFLAGSAIVPGAFVTPAGQKVNTWLSDADIEEELRHRFAASTCNGCHGGDSIRTIEPVEVLNPNGFYQVGFTHIDARPDRPFNVSGAMFSEFLCKADLVARVQAMTVFKSPTSTKALFAALPARRLSSETFAEVKSQTSLAAEQAMALAELMAGRLTDRSIALPQTFGASPETSSTVSPSIVDDGITVLLRNINRAH